MSESLVYSLSSWRDCWYSQRHYAIVYDRGEGLEGRGARRQWDRHVHWILLKELENGE